MIRQNGWVSCAGDSSPCYPGETVFVVDDDDDDDDVHVGLWRAGIITSEVGQSTRCPEITTHSVWRSVSTSCSRQLAAALQTAAQRWLRIAHTSLRDVPT